MLKNRVYYGEYTLKHWIDLMLRKNIVLPEYQRSFVWGKSKVKSFLKSIKEDQFIPPITIGCKKRNNKTENLIIDGQQRLTSLLLGVLEVYPKMDKFEYKDSIEFADENDDYEDEKKVILKWTFETLFNGKKDCSIESINKKIYTAKESEYEELDLDFIMDDTFLEEHYLGFSYLVPEDSEAQKYFSNTFKNINTAGVALTPLESRKSLYFLADGMEKFFDPSFCYEVSVFNGSKPEHIDFVRYLSFAFQYKKTRDFDSIAKNFARKYEEYYSDFIVNTVNNTQSEYFSICQQENKDRIGSVKKAFDEIGIKGLKFDSIIDVDLFFFGLVYFVIVEKKEIDIDKIEELKKNLFEKIDEFKKYSKHKKNPATLKFLRKRLNDSYEIYKGIVK